jgi:23S rRNA pseudouridine2605 synthase
MAEMRINRYLAQCGLGSRRECDQLIVSRAIAINGTVVTELGIKIDPTKVTVEFRGKPVAKPKGLEYIAYHKSRGTIVTATDPQSRETIYDALRNEGLNADHLKYVGRLDRNSEGLLLLTNDGDLIHTLTHPRFEIKKTYQVKTEKPLELADAEKMINQGIESEGQLLHAGAIKTLAEKGGGKESWYEVDLYEGKNRQIRRMFEALGYEVSRLKRIQFSVVTLGTLQRGKYRILQEREIKGLKNAGFKVKKRQQKK